jgi:hypothetical protein
VPTLLVAGIGIAAAAGGTALDGIQCVQNKSTLGCAGMIFNGVALGFATGGAVVPDEMTAGYGVVTAPYAVAALGIDTTAGAQDLGKH